MLGFSVFFFDEIFKDKFNDIDVVGWFLWEVDIVMEIKDVYRGWDFYLGEGREGSGLGRGVLRKF